MLVVHLNRLFLMESPKGSSGGASVFDWLDQRSQRNLLPAGTKAEG